jgi:hypothetical protein
MTVPVITPSAPRTEAVAGHACCLPVVRKLPPAAQPAGDRSW